MEAHARPRTHISQGLQQAVALGPPRTFVQGIQDDVYIRKLAHDLKEAANELLVGRRALGMSPMQGWQMRVSLELAGQL